MKNCSRYCSIVIAFAFLIGLIVYYLFANDIMYIPSYSSFYFVSSIVSTVILSSYLLIILLNNNDTNKIKDVFVDCGTISIFGSLGVIVTSFIAQWFRCCKVSYTFNVLISLCIFFMVLLFGGMFLFINNYILKPKSKN